MGRAVVGLDHGRAGMAAVRRASASAGIRFAVLPEIFCHFVGLMDGVAARVQGLWAAPPHFFSRRPAGRPGFGCQIRAKFGRPGLGLTSLHHFGSLSVAIHVEEDEKHNTREQHSAEYP